jgi:hypothetical protein
MDERMHGDRRKAGRSRPARPAERASLADPRGASYAPAVRTAIFVAALALLACRSEGRSKEPESTLQKAEGDVERAAHDVGDAVGGAAERAREVGRDVSESVGRTVDDALGSPGERSPEDAAGEDAAPKGDAPDEFGDATDGT